MIEVNYECPNTEIGTGTQTEALTLQRTTTAQMNSLAEKLEQHPLLLSSEAETETLAAIHRLMTALKSSR